ncbi:MAG: spherulation-specific family 4 protein [Chloroflexaceae bacterium]
MEVKRRIFCVYYSWLIADPAGQPASSAYRLATLQPDILIAPAFTIEPRLPNLSAPVMRLLRATGVNVLAYVDVAYGNRPALHVLKDVSDALALGVAGIFFDRTEYQWSASAAAYYHAIAGEVRRAGGLVALNPGVACVDEQFMRVADLLMVEHHWSTFISHSPWRHKYDPLQFMGVSSNEPGAYEVLGYHVTDAIALRDSRYAWASGIGWFCATDRYTEVPPWELQR